MITLSVMTFNLRYGTANDGNNVWDNRKDLVIQTLAKYQPTVVGIQEGLNFQLEYIASKLTDYRQFGISRRGNTEDEYSAILYDATQVELQEGGNFWLSETPNQPGSQSWDSSLPRMVTWARFRHQNSDREFYLFNTHFDHRGEIARQKSALLVWKRIREIDPNTPLFLTGDFNTVRKKTAWNFLVGNAPLEGECGELIDAWEEAPTRTASVTTTFHGFHGLEVENRRWQDGRWINGDSHIDWILFRPGVRVKYATIVTDNRNVRYPSDHYPVYAEFEIY